MIWAEKVSFGAYEFEGHLPRGRQYYNINVEPCVYDTTTW